jgi:hypothetical protein
MAEALTTATKLLVVREIQEDESGATLCFQQGAHGRLAASDPNYATHLQLARRSQERQHPVGVSFGEAPAVTGLIRADNDVPRELWEEDPDRALVLFEGHDGVFRLNLRSLASSRQGCHGSKRPPRMGCSSMLPKALAGPEATR